MREYRAAIAADPGFVPARVNRANALARRNLARAPAAQERRAP